jgi:hypothetical protein
MYYSLHNFHVRSWRRKKHLNSNSECVVCARICSKRWGRERDGVEVDSRSEPLAGKQHTIILNNNYCHDLWKSIFFFWLSVSKSILNSFSLQDRAGLLRISLETNERETGSRNELKNVDLRSVFSEGQFVRHSTYCCKHWNGRSEIF